MFLVPGRYSVQPNIPSHSPNSGSLWVTPIHVLRCHEGRISRTPIKRCREDFEPFFERALHWWKIGTVAGTLEELGCGRWRTRLPFLACRNRPTHSWRPNYHEGVGVLSSAILVPEMGLFSTAPLDPARMEQNTRLSPPAGILRFGCELELNRALLDTSRVWCTSPLAPGRSIRVGHTGDLDSSKIVVPAHGPTEDGLRPRAKRLGEGGPQRLELWGSLLLADLTPIYFLRTHPKRAFTGVVVLVVVVVYRIFKRDLKTPRSNTGNKPKPSVRSYSPVE